MIATSPHMPTTKRSPTASTSTSSGSTIRCSVAWPVTSKHWNGTERMKTLVLRDCDLAVLRRTFHRFPYVREVRVFGSRATGRARRASDIDLAISAPEATAEQWLELTEALESAPII